MNNLGLCSALAMICNQKERHSMATDCSNELATAKVLLEATAVLFSSPTDCDGRFL